MDFKQLESLLKKAATIHQQHQELKRLKGENFNVFSILNMETKENATHSAFLGELLNPNGSHLCGNSFLKHFLRAIEYKGQLDLESATITLEKHIGYVDYVAKTGGRIDIFISDIKDNSISIENKINAGDQPSQVKRYHTYNTERNTVYYLTLNGKDASDSSADSLESGKDYFPISYCDTIVEWLTLCQKEAVAQPILRETIRQYVLLIKKLTNQLTDNHMEKQVIDLIIENYHSVELLIENQWRADVEMIRRLLEDVKMTVLKEGTDGYSVTIDDKLNEQYKGINVTRPEWDDVAIEMVGYPLIHNSRVVFGIKAENTIWKRDDIDKMLAHNDFTNKGFFINHNYICFKFFDLFKHKQERVKLYDKKQFEYLNQMISGWFLDMMTNYGAQLSGLPKIK